MEPILRLDKINKRYPGVHANKDVSLAIYPGEIHALVGENGAGKSTLMKGLYGLEQPDSGTISLNGREVRIRTPREAIALGIGMVHQDFMLVPSFTVGENIVLGLEPVEGLRLRQQTINQQVRELSERFKLQVEPEARTGELPVGVQQRVEILKTLYRGVKLLILDEPTAVLTPQETADLFETMRRFTAEGKTIIFITHKLEEVMAVSHRVTVMRAGEVVGERLAGETSKEEIARLMVGRDVLLNVNKEPARPGKAVLEVKGVSVTRRGKRVLKDVSLAVAAGEILGIAGVQGNGQTELTQVVSGLLPWEQGEILINGVKLAQGNPLKVRQQGVAHIPENRDTQGLCLRFAVHENAILGQQTRFTRLGFIMKKRVEAHAIDLVNEFNVKVPDLAVNAQTLSGGNKQKLIVAREVAAQPELLVASQPTRGIDVGAIEFIHQRLVQLRDQGLAILLVSTELEEILGLSDRVLVMYEGEIVGEVDPRTTTEEQLGLLMAGVRRGEGTAHAARQQA